jgi:hypothetical protein
VLAPTTHHQAVVGDLGAIAGDGIHLDQRAGEDAENLSGSHTIRET